MARSGRSRPVLFHVVTVPTTLRSFFADQTRYQKASGFEVHTVSARDDDPEELAELLQATTHAVPLTRAITPLTDLVALWRLVRLFLRYRPVLVDSHTPKGGLLGTLAAWLAGVPIRIYSVHGLVYVGKSGWLRRLLKTTERVASLFAHRVLAVSHSSRKLLISDHLCRSAKITVIGHGSRSGVDCGRFSRAPEVLAKADALKQEMGVPSNHLVLGFVGRVARDKGICELQQAWEMLASEFPDLHLLVVGRMDRTDPIPARVEKALRDHPRVHLRGLRWEVVPYFAMMDVLALPTYREGLPVSLLEAQAMEVPVVSTRIPGCVDAVEDGRTGLLVEPRDAKALAGACRRLLLDEKLRREMGQMGRKRVARLFNPQRIQEQTCREYVRLMRERNIPVP